MVSKKKRRGFVYATVNPEYSHLIKIGSTESPNGDIENLKDRLKDLSSATGVPDSFVLCCAVEVKDDCLSWEKKLQRSYSKDRNKKNREFFRISIEQVEAAMGLFGSQSKNLRNYIEQEKKHHSDIFASAQKISARISPKSEGRVFQHSSGRGKRPYIDMHQLGIRDGAELIFIKDKTIKCKVMGARAVNFQGQKISLSQAAEKAFERIGESRKSLAGPDYWEYKGEILSKMRIRLESESKVRSSSKSQHSSGRKKRPYIDMHQLGIRDGAELIFIKDKTIKCKVMGARAVNFQGQKISLSQAAEKAFERIGESRKSLAGPDYWEYKGEILSKMRIRLELESK